MIVLRMGVMPCASLGACICVDQCRSLVVYVSTGADILIVTVCPGYLGRFGLLKVKS